MIHGEIIKSQHPDAIMLRIGLDACVQKLSEIAFQRSANIADIIVSTTVQDQETTGDGPFAFRHCLRKNSVFRSMRYNKLLKMRNYPQYYLFCSES